MKRSILLFVSLITLTIGGVSFKSTSDGFEIAKQIEIFVAFFKQLNLNYVDETNPAELMNTAMTAITKDLDPYTKFWTEQDVEASKIRSSGKYVGIGASLYTDDPEGEETYARLIISEAYKDFPADKSGLKPGDEIIKVGETEVKNYEGRPGDLLKGEAGTKVKLTFLRQGKKQTTSVNRSLIEVDAVPFYKLLSDNTGYIILRRFSQKASSNIINALRELEAEGADKLILDLRGNPGGLLTEAVNVCNIFVEKDLKIVNTESVVNDHKKEYKTKHQVLYKDIPLAVLVNGRSASASEIVSGSMQDLDRGVVIGARSFGKGLVQSKRPLKHNTQLKITTSRYFIPSGRCIQALDYWHRDNHDKPTRIKKSDFKAFKTRNGRTVYDGGGVFPDIEIETTKLSNIASALLKERVIFDYATQFYYSNNFKKLADFKFTDTDYSDFLNYMKKSKFEFKTKTDNLLEDLWITAEKETLDKQISSQYKSLKDRLSQAKKEALKAQENEIKEIIKKEIIKRYFYREGVHAYEIANSEEVREAQKVLADKTRYNKILGKN